MKRAFSIIAACIVLLATISAVAEISNDEQAWDVIYSQVYTQLGYTQDQLSKIQLESGDGVWAFSLMVANLPDDNTGIIVGQMNNNGNLLTLQGPEIVSLNQQLEYDLKSCFNQDDCYLRLATVCDQWFPILSALPYDQLNALSEEYAAVIRLHITTPVDTAITYSDAYDAAVRYLAQQPGWDETKAHMFRLCISAYYTPEDIGKPVYFFYFEQHSYMEAAYESDSAMDKYQSELNQAFDGSAPRRFSLMIDATDKSLVETPIYDYAPVQYHYLDFLIRTQAIIDAGKGTGI